MKWLVCRVAGMTPTQPKKKAALLPYGTHISAPAITLPDVSLFKHEKGYQARNFFEERLEKLNREYKELVELAEETHMVYSARYNFIPKVGQIYHLHWTGNDYILSLVEKFRHVEYKASYRFTADGTWEKIND